MRHAPMRVRHHVLDGRHQQPQVHVRPMLDGRRPPRMAGSCRRADRWPGHHHMHACRDHAIDIAQCLGQLLGERVDIAHALLGGRGHQPCFWNTCPSDAKRSPGSPRCAGSPAPRATATPPRARSSCRPDCRRPIRRRAPSRRRAHRRSARRGSGWPSFSLREAYRSCCSRPAPARQPAAGPAARAPSRKGCGHCWFFSRLLNRLVPALPMLDVTWIDENSSSDWVLEHHGLVDHIGGAAGMDGREHAFAHFHPAAVRSAARLPRRPIDSWSGWRCRAWWTTGRWRSAPHGRRANHRPPGRHAPCRKRSGRRRDWPDWRETARRAAPGARPAWRHPRPGRRCPRRPLQPRWRQS